jgi:hypothetical protein
MKKTITTILLIVGTILLMGWNVYTNFVYTGNMTLNGLYDAEKVANGDFATDTVWVKGANWTIAAGVAHKSTGAANNLSQNTTEAAGETYKITYTLINLSGGSITVSMGGVSGIARTTDGTYTEYITASGTGDLTFTPSVLGVVVDVDNVSAVKMTGAATFENDVTLTGGDLTASAGDISSGVSLNSQYNYVKLDTIVQDTAGAPPTTDCDAAAEVGRALISTRYTATAEYRLWICTQTAAGTFAWKYVVLT